MAQPATAADGTSVEPAHGAIDRAAQLTFERAIAARVPDADPAGVALLVYATGTGRLVEAFQSSIVRQHDLDGAQFSVLFTLWCTEPPHLLSPTELHRLLVQSPSGMSHTLRRLAGAALIRRRGDRADGRAKYVELTAKGIRRLQRCIDDLVAALEELYAEIPAAKVAELADAQRQVTALLSRSPRSYPVTSRPLATGGRAEREATSPNPRARRATP